MLVAKAKEGKTPVKTGRVIGEIREDERRIPSRNWIHYFIQRNSKTKYCFVSRLQKSRANAESWDVMDDFFAKVLRVPYITEDSKTMSSIEVS
jgi:hypothetical protein